MEFERPKGSVVYRKVNPTSIWCAPSRAGPVSAALKGQTVNSRRFQKLSQNPILGSRF
jgi:hypothetical protein